MTTKCEHSIWHKKKSCEEKYKIRITQLKLGKGRKNAFK